ncbi:TetR/AcrR family transcriptional regulator [Aestuariirhabdus litorea]|uniref:TetR/AcrR family transcriptional regulator n=1 Tax=Aestuariirhabdus litorea TaxID=2528527 RepID=A0A3P3VMC0_9GAMM|nr:TetR/AcrR family transcriptional regulator [Aestuariirhabdus litorea]RRJ83780.1 TetR/AcrR family transcriptional regulator [Aestuariirhabdus litorea]RWW97003.1 TetR family transcriptional regulator [Endozoicomonadaceae bacterium GTF-13]
MVRTRSKSEEKRDQILEAAVTLFIEQGFDATSMDQIAQLASVSKQTVYSHFGNKEELFSASIRCKCISHQLAEADFREFNDPRSALATIALRFHELLHSPEAIHVHRTCVAQSETHPQLSSLFFKEGPNSMFEQVARLLESFSARGLLRVEEPRFAAVQFLMMVHGESRLRLELNVPPLPEEENQRYIDNCIDAFMRAYGV